MSFTKLQNSDPTDLGPGDEREILLKAERTAECRGVALVERLRKQYKDTHKHSPCFLAQGQESRGTWCNLTNHEGGNAQRNEAVTPLDGKKAQGSVHIRRGR